MPGKKDDTFQDVLSRLKKAKPAASPTQEAITRIFSDQAEEDHNNLTSDEQKIVKPVIEDAVNDLNSLTKYKNYSSRSTGSGRHEISVEVDSFRITVKVKNGQFDEVKSIVRI